MPTRRAAPTAFAMVLALGTALSIAGCAASDTAKTDSVKSLSDLSKKEGSMLKLGDASRAAGDCQAAVRFYRLVKEDSLAEAAAARSGSADCELSMNDLAEAARDYRQAMKLAPQAAEPLVGLGRIALVQHKPGEAATYLEQALKKGGDAAFVWNDQGVAYDQLRRHKEAQQIYRQGLAKYPSDPALRNNLALSLAMTGDFKEAEALLRGLASEPSASARTRENLALVLGLEGNGAEARKVSQADLDGAALDNNARFYQYARANIVGGPVPSQTAFHDDGDDTPPTRAERGETPVPPPVLDANVSLRALRPAEPSKLEQATVTQTDLGAPTPAKAPPPQAEAKEAPPTQTAALPPAAAEPAKPAAAPGAPTRIVASDGGALAKPAGPVASSENQ